MTEEDEEEVPASGQTTETETEEESSGPAYRRLTDAEFAKIREFYELGIKSMVDLADEFGVSRQTLSRRFKQEGVVKGSRAHEMAKVAGQALKQTEEERITFANQQAKWIEETRLGGYQALKRAELMTHKLILEGRAAAKSYEHMAEDLKVLERYSKIIQNNVAARLELLNTSEYVDEESLPMLRVEDLTDEEVLEHHKRTNAVPEDMTVEEMIEEQLQTMRELGLEEEE